MESKAESISTSKKVISSSFLYLFIMDLCRVPFQTFKVYQDKEPGFAEPYFKGYIAAFEMETKGKMSHELLKSIHGVATTHLGAPNEYRDDHGNFNIALSKVGAKFVPTYSATPEGLKQFIREWITGAKTHSIGFDNGAPEDKDRIIYIVTSEDNTTILKIFENKQVRAYTFNEEKHLPIILKFMETNAISEMNPMELVERSALRSTTHKHLDSIFDKYNTAIKTAKTDEEKIRIICKYVQLIEQLHPFMDGNIRTCHILLNKLLHDFNMPLSLLLNPNHLDCFTVDELVSQVKDGQAVYSSLLSHEGSNNFTFKTNEKLESLKSISCPAVTLECTKTLEQFSLCVLNSESKKTKVTGQDYHSDLLKEIEKEGSPAKLVKLIKEKKYGLALRQACAENVLSIVKGLLSFKDALHININETSSNGNTALDWCDLSKNNRDDHLKVRALLVEHGAKNNKVTPQDSGPSDTEEVSIKFKG